jgi:hypothetical protein
MRLLLGTGIRLVIVIALIAGAILFPLLTFYRSRCRVHGKIENHWAFVLPGHDAHMKRCGKPEKGLQVLLREVGLK